jgi:hypothetical protein
MLIGILADIHEELDPLRRALAEFRRHSVDLVVTLGDACDILLTDGRAEEVVRLLREVNAIGVWGNHDVGLCVDQSDRVRQRYSPDVLAFMAGLQGHLAVEDCLFSHVEPWLDSHDPLQLWYWEGLPDTCRKIERSFQAVPQRFMFVGHFHRWQLMTASEPMAWDGCERIVLDSGTRYLIAVAAVCDGHCGLFDTSRRELRPVRIAVAPTVRSYSEENDSSLTTRKPRSLLR